MKLIIAFAALAALSAPAFAQSTTAKVPTGYQVKGATDYKLVNGPNWTVKQVKDKCDPKALGTSETKCVTTGSHAN